MKMRKYVQAAAASVLAVQLALAGAPAAAIGVAIQNGDFRLNSARVHGNATLFAGNLIETEKGQARLYLQTGAKIQLAADSRAKVFAENLSLESGETGFSGSPYRVDALSLRVRTESPEASARVRLAGPGTVEVGAVQGNVSVYNHDGVLLARVAEGTALDLTPQAEAPSTMRVSGTMKKVKGHFLVEDRVTKVTVELRGQDLERGIGKQVQISGTVLPEKSKVGAAQVIEVSSLEVLSHKARKGAAAGAAAGGAGGLFGMGITTTAIVVGTAVAVAGAAAALSVSSGGQEQTAAISPSTP